MNLTSLNQLHQQNSIANHRQLHGGGCQPKSATESSFNLNDSVQLGGGLDTTAQQMAQLNSFRNQAQMASGSSSSNGNAFFSSDQSAQQLSQQSSLQNQALLQKYQAIQEAAQKSNDFRGHFL